MILPTFGKNKRNINPCNKYPAKSKYQEGYDPAYKLDLPYKDLVENTNTISEKAEENQVIDESSCPYCGYGEAGSGICGRLSPKQFAKGGKTIMCIESGRLQIRAYTHRHNQGWSDAGTY